MTLEEKTVKNILIELCDMIEKKRPSLSLESHRAIQKWKNEPVGGDSP